MRPLLALVLLTLTACGSGKPEAEPDAGAWTPPTGGTTDGGGGIRKATLSLPDNPRLVNPRFSHDGARIAFTRLGSNGAADAVVLMDATGGNVTVINESASYLTGFDFSADGQTLLYSGSGVYTVPVAGGTPTAVLSSFDGFASYGPDLSPDGTKLIFAVNGSTLKLVDLTQTPPVLTSLPMRGNSPRFSPDGQTIVYADTEASMIRLMNADGTNVRDVVASDGFFASVDWMSDGQRIIATTDVAMELITLGTQPLQRRTLDKGFAVMDLDVSPDDQKLVYTVNGQMPLYVLSGL